jgi:hypothetical protein
VFGLWLEHSCPDRDVFVQYSCVNLNGFAEAFTKSHQDDKTKDDLCKDQAVADKYGFPSTEYMVETEAGDSMSSTYDHSTIMHYYSRVFADGELIHDDPNNPDFHALAVLCGGYKYIITSQVPQFEISDLDADAIRRMYSWKG